MKNAAERFKALGYTIRVGNIPITNNVSYLSLIKDGLIKRFKGEDDFEQRCWTYCEEVALELGLSFNPTEDASTLAFKVDEII